MLISPHYACIGIIVLTIRVERAVYSVVEGEYLDVCIVVIRGTVVFSFSVSVYLTTPCKALASIMIGCQIDSKISPF